MSCSDCDATFGKLREFVNTIRDGELLRRKLDELAELRAYKERTEAGLLKLSRTMTNQNDLPGGLSARVVELAQGTIKMLGLWRDPPQEVKP